MRLLSAVGLLAWGAAAAADQPKFAWPDGRQSAIVLTYDDAIRASDLEVAAPQLDRASEGTFNGFVGTSAADMIAWVKQVESAGALGVVVFHGVGDHLSITGEAHQQLLDYLAAHRRTIWTARLSEVMGYVVKHGH